LFFKISFSIFATVKYFSFKQVLDKIFGQNNFKNKITWKRADTHNDAKHQMPNVTDDIFYYSKSDKYTFNVQYTEHNAQTLKDWYQFLEFPDGTIRKMTKEEINTQKIPANARRFNAADIASPNPRPNLMYEYKGFSYPTKGWRYSLETMQELDEKGLLFFPKEKTGRIMRKRFLDEQKGAVLGDFWQDISQVRAKSPELIGYPTQKPEALLQRIIEFQTLLVSTGYVPQSEPQILQRIYGLPVLQSGKAGRNNRIADQFGGKGCAPVERLCQLSGCQRRNSCD
jgi:hypothetical protein